ADSPHRAARRRGAAGGAHTSYRRPRYERRGGLASVPRWIAEPWIPPRKNHRCRVALGGGRRRAVSGSCRGLGRAAGGSHRHRHRSGTGRRQECDPCASDRHGRRGRSGRLWLGTEPGSSRRQRHGLDVGYFARCRGKAVGAVEGHKAWALERGGALEPGQLAAELIGLRDDVIIALGPAALEAAKARTATVPIVASDLESDPVAAGFVASLARPGGNMTGTFLDQTEISGKWLELLKTAIPKLSRVAVLCDSTTPSHQLKALKMGAPALAVTLQTLAVRGPEDFQGAFTAAARQHAQGVVILSSPLVLRSGPNLRM